jgi:hypothetical protein
MCIAEIRTFSSPRDDVFISEIGSLGPWRLLSKLTKIDSFYFAIVKRRANSTADVPLLTEGE